MGDLGDVLYLYFLNHINVLPIENLRKNVCDCAQVTHFPWERQASQEK